MYKKTLKARVWELSCEFYASATYGHIRLRKKKHQKYKYSLNTHIQQLTG